MTLKIEKIVDKRRTTVRLIGRVRAEDTDIERQDVKDRLRQNTDRAVERGVFGAPTFFVGSEMFWGNDRFDFVEEALRKLV